MSNPILLQDEISGIFRDKSRDDLPRGKFWDLVDYIPNKLGAPIRKRGGWGQHGDELTDLDASAGAPVRVGVVSFAGANEKRAIRIVDDGGLGGTFTLTYSGQTTTGIAYNASASAIQSALEALSNIAPGDVSVYNDEDGVVAPETMDVIIEFTGTLAAQDIPTASFSIDLDGLTGSFSAWWANAQTGGAPSNQVVAIDDRANPELFDLTNGVDRGSVYGATASAPLGPLVSYRNLLLIPSPSIAGTPTGPRKYQSNGTIAALSGSPPGTRFFAVYKDRVAAASADTDTPNRVFFSGAGDPESWDTTNRWIDTSSPPVGLAPLRNMLLVFHDDSVERIRGSVPPGSPAANMELEPLFDNMGLADPFALHVADEYAYWADEEGVYRTDGSGYTDLTELGGIKRYWREQFAEASGGVALTVWRGYVWVSLLGASDAYLDFLVYDIDRRSWFRFDNIQASSFAHFFGGGADELVFASRDASITQVGELSTVFDPENSTIDGNGDEIEPVWETPFYDVGTYGKKRVKHVYLTHQLDDTASQDPNLTLSYVDDPASEAYTSFGSFTETSGNRLRQRLKLGKARGGIALRGVQTNRSGDTRLYAIEADIHLKEGSGR